WPTLGNRPSNTTRPMRRAGPAFRRYDLYPVAIAGAPVPPVADVPEQRVSRTLTLAYLHPFAFPLANALVDRHCRAHDGLPECGSTCSAMRAIADCTASSIMRSACNATYEE